MAFNFEQQSVLVIGDIMLDRYWSGDAARISPEAPVPVVNVKEQSEVLGGAANVACNLRTLGAKVHLLGILGDDDLGRKCQHLLSVAGIESYTHIANAKPTISKLRITSHEQQMLRIDHEESFAAIDKSSLFENFINLLPKVDLVIASDYNKGTLSDIARYITTCRKYNKKILIDPKGNDFSKYKGATLISPNRNEFTTIVGACTNQQELTNKAQLLRAELELDAILITQGADGMSLIQNNTEPLHEKSFSAEVVDVTGAGDTVLATFGLMVAAGKPLELAMRMANSAASVAVNKARTYHVTNQELMIAFHKNHKSKMGALSLDELIIAVEQERACGEKIVFTNGCFDILHAGHIAYLEKTKQLGDKLIVAINDDASIKRLKGSSRPYAPLESRIKVLAALKAVDWVVVFSEDTPLNLIKAINPDVLAKGADYKIVDIVGATHVQSYGGEVVAVQHDYTDISSSKILATMDAAT